MIKATRHMTRERVEAIERVREALSGVSEADVRAFVEYEHTEQLLRDGKVGEIVDVYPDGTDREVIYRD